MQNMTNDLSAMGYPTWRVALIPGSEIPGVEGSGSFEVWRRADDCAVVGSAGEWKYVGSYSSYASAVGAVEETVEFEQWANRRSDRWFERQQRIQRGQ